MSKLFIILLVLSTVFQPLTQDNVTQLKEVKRIGNGVFTGALATSPNGETLAVGGSIGIWLYQTDDFTQAPTLIDLDVAVDDVQFSKDGRYLAYRSGNDFTLLEYETRREVMRDEGVDSFAFHPDSSMLALGKTIDPQGQGIYTASPIMELWDVEHNQLVKTFDLRSQTKARDYTLELAFSPDGETLASSISDFTFDTCGQALTKVLLWRVDEGVEQIPTVISDAERVIFNSKGTHIASMEQIVSMGLTEDIILWDVAQEEVLTRLEFPEEEQLAEAIDFTFSPDGEMLTALFFNEVTVWNVSNGQVVARQPLDYIVSGVILLDQQMVIVQPANLILWEYGTENTTKVDLEEAITNPEMNAQGTIITSFKNPSRTEVWAGSSVDWQHRIFTKVAVGGNVVAYVDNGKLGVWDVIFDKDLILQENVSDDAAFYLSNNGQVLGYADDTVTLWDAVIGKKISTLSEELSNPILFFSPDNTYVISSDFIKEEETYLEFKLWEVATGKLIRNIVRHVYEGAGGTITFSPDSKQFAIQTDGITGRVYDTETGESVFNNEVTDEGGSFSPDLESFFLDTGDYSTVRLQPYEVDTGEVISTYINYFYAGGIQAFSPDSSKMVVSTSSHTNCGGDFRAFYLWDIENWQEITTIPLPSAPFSSGKAMFSPDSEMLIVSYANYTSFFDTNTGEEIAEIDGLNYADIAFQQDTDLLVAAEDDGTIRIYGVQ